MPGKLKRVVRTRMALTGESYSTALMRVRECTAPFDSDDQVAAKETIRVSPPRKGSEKKEG